MFRRRPLKKGLSIRLPIAYDGLTFRMAGTGRMRIVADENIPFVREAFGRLGDVTILSGRRMTPEAVRQADILLVRSVTRINAELLDRSTVRFVGTATIGTDHVDEQYLQDRGITWASAPGSNANSVAEYVLAALLKIAGPLRGKTLGVIGVGQVGSKVARYAEALGLGVQLNDPPLERTTGDERFRPIEELFGADILTLHVPLTREGEDATFHLVDEKFLGHLKPGAILLNTARGAVVETAALQKALDSGLLAAAIVDVWEGEPEISTDLLDRVALGTPHIAGYSFDGKVRGTQMLHRAACDFLGVDDQWDPSDRMPPPEPSVIPLDSAEGPDEHLIAEAVAAAYDIEADDARLREITELEPGRRGAHFDRLRREYPVRREFPAYTLDGPTGRLKRVLARLGFQVGGND